MPSSRSTVGPTLTARRRPALRCADAATSSIRGEELAVRARRHRADPARLRPRLPERRVGVATPSSSGSTSTGSPSPASTSSAAEPARAPATWKRCSIAEYGARPARRVRPPRHRVARRHRPQPGRRHGAAGRPRPPGRFRAIVLVAPVSTSGLDFLPPERFASLCHPTRDEQVALARAAFRRPPPAAELEALVAVIGGRRPSASRAPPCRSATSPWPTSWRRSTSEPCWCAATATATSRSATTSPRGSDPALRAAGLLRRRPRAVPGDARPLRRRRRARRTRSR